MIAQCSCDLLQNTLYSLQRIRTHRLFISSPNKWSNDINELQLLLEDLQKGQELLTRSILLQITLTFLNDTIFTPQLRMIEEINDNNLTLDDFVEDMEYFMMKIKYIREWIPKIMATDKNCIFCKDQSSPEWQTLNKFIHHIDIDTPLKIQQENDRFVRFTSVGFSYHMLSRKQYLSPITKFIKQNLGGLYYLIRGEQARRASLAIICRANLEFAQGVWGMMGTNKSTCLDNNLAAKIMLKSGLYLPRLFSPITLDVIQKDIIENKLYEFQNFNSLDLIEENIYEKLKENLELKRNRDSKVKVRLLCDRRDILRQNIDIQGAIQQATNICTSNYQMDQQTNYDCGTNNVKNIIIHIHGGGWVAMSSFSHQMYTRKWANLLGPNCLIVSIDYRLVPKYPYPSALDDCWQVYLWILYFSKFYLNVDPQKIIIAGDSAGGNMALGICLRALRLGVPQPEGLLLSYPAMNLDLNIYTPSQLYSLNDKFLSVTVLQEVLQSYMQSKEVRPDIDPYLSPGLADEKFIKALPDKISIICGSQDTLKDECIKFINKLIEAKCLRKPNPYPAIHIYNGFSHGFLNYDFLLGLSTAKHIIQHCGDIIQGYLN